MELSEIEGVSSVKADLDLKMIKVTYSPPAKESILREKLAEINYPAED
jgi:copper chaperone CopZ